MVGVITNACLIAFTSSWGNSFDFTGQLTIVIAFEVDAYIVTSLQAYVSDMTPYARRLHQLQRS